MTYVLTLMDGSYFIITPEQAKQISDAQNAKQFRSVQLGDQYVVLNQVTGIVTLEVYRRNIKHKLAQKNLRICRRCHEILPMNAECPCTHKHEKYPDILEQSKKENPKLAAALDLIAERSSMPV